MALNAPSSFKATSTKSTIIKTSWGAVEGATAYYLTCTELDETRELTSTSSEWTGLTPNTSYNFTLYATTSEDVTEEATCSFTTFVDDLDAPEITLTKSGSTVIVSWDEVQNAESYQVWFKDNNTSSWTTVTVSATSYSINNLSAGANDIKVKALATSMHGESDFSEVASILRLSIPTWYMFIPKTGILRVEWAPVENADLYRFFYKLTSGTAYTVEETSATLIEIPNLTNGDLYQWYVQATSVEHIDSYGTSAVRSKIQDAIQSPNITATQNGATNVVLSWDAIDGAYNYLRRTKALNSTVWTGSSNYSTTSCTIANGKYVYRFYTAKRESINNSYIWAYSEGVDISVIKLGTPSSLSYVAGPRLIQLSWNAVEYADTYTVSYKKTSDSSYQTCEPTTATSIIITGLDKTTQYNVRVQATSDNPTKILSGYNTATITTKELTKPQVALTATLTTIEATWESIPFADAYIVEYGIASYNRRIYDVTTETSIVLRDLTPSTTYYIYVQAICNDTTIAGSSYGSNSIKTATPSSQLSAPTFSSTSTTATSIEASWNAVEGADEYYLSYSKGTYLSGVYVTTKTTQAVIEGLESGITYYLRVKAISNDPDVSNSAYSSYRQVFTTGVALPTPTVVARTPAQIELSWTTLSGIDEYVIEYSTTEHGVYQTAAITSSGSAVINGLSSKRPYYFRIKSVSTDPDYNGLCSSATYVDVYFPAIGGVGARTSSSITLYFQRPCNYLNTAWLYNFDFMYAEVGSNEWTTIRYIGTSSSSSINKYTFSNLDPGVSYKFKIRGDNGVYVSDWTNEIIGTTYNQDFSSKLATPVSLTFVNKGTCWFEVSWSPVSNAVCYRIVIDNAYAYEVGNVTTAIIPFERPNQNKQFKLQAISDGVTRGDSSLSNATTIYTAQLIDPPPEIDVVSITGSTVLLSISHSSIYATQIAYAEDGTDEYTHSTPTEENSCLITGLSPDTTYKFIARANDTKAVRLINSTTPCESYWSDPITLTTLPAVPLSPPTGLTKDTVTSTSARVGWNAVTNATDYKVEYRVQGQTNWIENE